MVLPPLVLGYDELNYSYEAKDQNTPQKAKHAEDTKIVTQTKDPPTLKVR